MFKTEGILHYSNCKEEFRLVAEVCPDLSSYYMALLPKAYPRRKQKYQTHCTVVRPTIEVPLQLGAWGKYENEVVELFYDPFIFFDGPYYKLDVWCERLVEIRKELGLPPKRRRRDGTEFQCFHITIANRKGLV